MNNLRERLRIKVENLEEINSFILREDNPIVNGLLEIVEKYGGVNEINRRAQEARKIENLMERLRRRNSPFVKDIEWLIEQRDKEAFISIHEYRRKILGEKAESMTFDESFAVTLEISACNFF
ncbi:hypothetical protein KAT21_05200, partial [Candidatus Bathyarchaeota archaeon]|nr:hypothetical protein [Candidatus Bathyarchaeota archaeon]